MYSVEGGQLYIYINGQKTGPFSLFSLLDLISGSRRRLLDSVSGLSISSLDYDGSSLWLVLSNGWVPHFSVWF